MEHMDSLSNPPLVKDLVFEHATAIEDVLRDVRAWVSVSSAEVSKAANAAPLDELFVLRFLLSNKKNSHAQIVDKIQQTLTWRGENHDNLVEVAAGASKVLAPIEAHLCRAYVGRSKYHSIFVERQGHNRFDDLHKMVDAYSSKNSTVSLADALLLFNEYQFRKVDVQTRETGRLGKVLIILPLDKIPMFVSPTMMKVIWAYSASSKKSAVFYPQLLGSMVLFSGPSMGLKLALKLAHAFASKTTAEKLTVCPGAKAGLPPSACPALKRIDPARDWDELMPSCLSGHGVCPANLKSKRYPEDE